MCQALVQLAMMSITAHAIDMIKGMQVWKLLQVVLTSGKQAVGYLEPALLEIEVPGNTYLRVVVFLSMLIPGKSRLSALTETEDLIFLFCNKYLLGKEYFLVASLSCNKHARHFSGETEKKYGTFSASFFQNENRGSK